MAETAKKTTPKGMEGVEAIMNGDRVMDVATGSRKAPEAPYEMIGDSDSPTPTAESYAQETAPRPKETRSDSKTPKYDEKAFEAYVSKHGKLKTFEATLAAFFAYELAAAKRAMAKLKSPKRIIQNAARVGGGKGKKSRKSRERKSRQDDEQDG